MVFYRCSYNPSTAGWHICGQSQTHTLDEMCVSLHFIVLQHFHTVLPCLPGHRSICCPRQLSCDYMKSPVNNNFGLLVLPLSPLHFATSIRPSWCHSIFISPLMSNPFGTSSSTPPTPTVYEVNIQSGFISLDITDWWHLQGDIFHGYLHDALIRSTTIGPFLLPLFPQMVQLPQKLL